VLWHVTNDETVAQDGILRHIFGGGK